jgi:hypothetical protein
MLQQNDSSRERKPFLPSKDEHLSKARENQAFAESLLTSGRAERQWGLIVRFYSAVHYVEAYLSGVNRGTATHEARRRAIRERRELAAVAASFNELYNLAWNARYLCLACPLEDVIRAHDILLQVQRHIENLL